MKGAGISPGVSVRAEGVRGSRHGKNADGPWRVAVANITTCPFDSSEQDGLFSRLVCSSEHSR